MRQTVPWIPSLGASDDGELIGAAVHFALMVGVIVRRYGETVPDDVLIIALAALFGSALDRLDDDRLVAVVAGGVRLALGLGLVERAPGGYRTTVNMLPTQPWLEGAPT